MGLLTRNCSRMRRSPANGRRVEETSPPVNGCSHKNNHCAFLGESGQHRVGVRGLRLVDQHHAKIFARNAADGHTVAF